MPRGNKMGPEDQGPLTGRRMGYCAGSNTPGFQYNAANQGFGHGRGQGPGRGNGRGFGVHRNSLENSTRTSIQEEILVRNEIAVLNEKISVLEEKIDKIIKND